MTATPGRCQLTTQRQSLLPAASPGRPGRRFLVQARPPRSRLPGLASATAES
ncbi:hypothetical protein ACRAWF_08010 [Streptomyces sp. L7]